MHTHTQSAAILLYQPLITICTKVLLGHVMLCWFFFCMAAHPIADIAGGRMPIFCDVFFFFFGRVVTVISLVPSGSLTKPY